MTRVPRLEGTVRTDKIAQALQVGSGEPAGSPHWVGLGNRVGAKFALFSIAIAAAGASRAKQQNRRLADKLA